MHNKSLVRARQTKTSQLAAAFWLLGAHWAFSACISKGDTNIGAERCGDGVVDAKEACDDGNRKGGDGCAKGCQVEDGWTCADDSDCVQDDHVEFDAGTHLDGPADGETEDSGSQNAIVPSGTTSGVPDSASRPSVLSTSDAAASVSSDCDERGRSAGALADASTTRDATEVEGLGTDGDDSASDEEQDAREILPDGGELSDTPTTDPEADDSVTDGTPATDDSQTGDVMTVDDTEADEEPTTSSDADSAPMIHAFISNVGSLPGGGGTINLSWEVDDAAELYIAASTGDDIGSVSGSFTSTEVTRTTTFTLIARNGEHEAEKDVAIVVSAVGELDWNHQFGSGSADAVEGIDVDSSGTLVACGYTEGILGGSTEGLQDAFVAAYSPEGEQLWLQQWGSDGVDVASKLVSDDLGGVLIVGSTDGTMGEEAYGGIDTFITRYNTAEREFDWTEQLGSGADEIPYDLALDEEGSVFVVGYTTGRLETGSSDSQNGYDAFLAKYANSGEQLGLWQFGGSGDEVAAGVAVAPSGTVYVVGHVDPDGTGEATFDAFLKAFTNSGTLLWSEEWDSGQDDYADTVVVAGNGHVFVAGRTYGDLDDQNRGQEDAYVREYQADKTLLMRTQFGSTRDDRPVGLVFDAAGNVFVGGYTNGDLDENDGVGNTVITDYDGFLAKLNPSGDRIWLQQFSSDAAPEYVSDVIGTPQGHILLGGITAGDLFDGNAGGYDAFVVRFR